MVRWCVRRIASDVGRAEALLGREYYLDAEIARGFGQIRVADSVWRVTGPELPAGVKVKVVAVDSGGSLRVEQGLTGIGDREECI